MPSFSILWPFHHCGRDYLLSYQLINLCSRTQYVFVANFTLIFTADDRFECWIIASILLFSFNPKAPLEWYLTLPFFLYSTNSTIKIKKSQVSPIQYYPLTLISSSFVYVTCFSGPLCLMTFFKFIF